MKVKFEHEEGGEGILTAKYAEYANGVKIKNFAWFRCFRWFPVKHLLLGKVEKNGTSPKTWYWAIFGSAKVEAVEIQNDPDEIEHNRSLKFLQFLENFSGGGIWGGGGRK